MQIFSSLCDTELIRLFNQGCKKAFDILFLRYKEDVRIVILHYVKNRVETEDLTQDVFLKIHTSFTDGKYNEQGKFLPWALCIARNLCLDHLRKAAQFPFVGKVCYGDSFYTPVQDNSENKLVIERQERQLNILISQLPADLKKVVCYRYFDDMSFKEISVSMNTSVNTSLGRMRYGLMHLRKQVNNTPSFWCE